MTDQEQIDFIMRYFNFERIAKMRTITDWDYGNGQVTESMLKHKAAQLFADLVKEPDLSSVRTGGLRAGRKRDEFGHIYFYLEFIGESYSSEGA